MKSFLLAGVALVASMAAAQAADLVYPETSTPPVVESPAPIMSSPAGYDWTGLYIGLQAGIIGDNLDLDFNGGSTTLDDFGAIGGAHIGYDYQFGNGFLIGAETDINATSLKNRVDFTGGNGVNNAEIAKLDYTGSVTGKIGYAVDNLLMYGKGGFAYAHVDDADIAFDSDFATGYTLGGGIALGLTQSISLRTEYNFSRYDDFDVKANGVTAGSADFDTHTIESAISYRF
jgi:outer membrane immunogenic protein